MKVGLWSTTAGNNNATPPDGFPELQFAGTLNDCAREMMAQLAIAFRSLDYIDLGNTPSYVNATQFSLGTADTTNFEVGRRVKLFDATTLYGTIYSVSAANVMVRLDSGALTSSLSSVAVGVMRNTSNALPAAAYQAQNIVTNGDLDIWQRGNAFTAVANNAYLADRFKFESGNTTAVFDVTRLERSAGAALVPTLAQAGRLINSALNVNVTTPDGVVVAGEYAAISTTIEGYDWRKIAHRPMSVEFWVNTNKSGTYALSIRNAGASLSYVHNYTISAINTWTRFFVPIPEAPTTQTWDYSTGVGLRLAWTLAAGATYQATGDEWSAMNALATSSQVNFFSSAGNSLAITGVCLKPGWADTPTAPSDIGTEYQQCARYYWRGLPSIGFNAPSYTIGSVMTWIIGHPVPMRAIPTVSLVAPGAAYSGCGSATADAATPFGFRFLMFSTQETNNANVLFDASTDYFTVDAELL